MVHGKTLQEMGKTSLTWNHGEAGGGTIDFSGLFKVETRVNGIQHVFSLQFSILIHLGVW